MPSQEQSRHSAATTSPTRRPSPPPRPRPRPARRTSTTTSTASSTRSTASWSPTRRSSSGLRPEGRPVTTGDPDAGQAARRIPLGRVVARSPSSSARTPRSCCRRGGALPPGQHARGAARHDHRHRDVRRRRRHGRRPPGHDGQPHRQPRDREGLRRPTSTPRSASPARPARHRAGQAVPGRARALREDRGRADVPRGQGQPARRR